MFHSLRTVHVLQIPDFQPLMNILTIQTICRTRSKVTYLHCCLFFQFVPYSYSWSVYLHFHKPICWCVYWNTLILCDFKDTLYICYDVNIWLTCTSHLQVGITCCVFEWEEYSDCKHVTCVFWRTTIQCSYRSFIYRSRNVDGHWHIWCVMCGAVV